MTDVDSSLRDRLFLQARWHAMEVLRRSRGPARQHPFPGGFHQGGDSGHFIHSSPLP
jgi:hypothetical protein